MKNLLNEHEFYNFPKFLRTIRDIHFLTREDAAKILRWNTSDLANLERGLIKFPKKDQLDALCVFYQIPEKIMQVKVSSWIEEWGSI